MKKCLDNIVNVCTKRTVVLANGHKVNHYINETDLALNLDRYQLSQQVEDYLSSVFKPSSSTDGISSSAIDKIDDVSDVVNPLETRHIQFTSDKNEYIQLAEQYYQKALERCDNEEKEKAAKEKYDAFLASIGKADKVTD